MATKVEELANPNGCLNRAADDEPVFVLRAHDENAPVAVEHWVGMYMHSKGGTHNMSEAQHIKAAEAMQLAHNMRRWKRNLLLSSKRVAVEGDL